MPMAPSAAGEGLVTRQEAEALGLLAQQHRAQIAVAQTNLTLVGDGAGDAERLQGPSPMHSAGLAAVLTPFFSAIAAPKFVRPLGVFEGDGLDALHDLVSVDALGVVCKPSAPQSP